MGLTDRGPIEAMLAFGLLFVVPAGVRVHRQVSVRWTPWVFWAAVAATFALQSSHPVTPVVLSLPWVLVSAALAATAGWRWLTGPRSLAGVAWPAALAYLAVGAGWLLVHALKAEPVGIRPPFVLLTAVHFHFAGFIATLLAACVGHRTFQVAPRVSAAMLGAVVVAPPIVAAGFTFAGPLQIVGAVVLTAGLFALSWLTLRHVTPAVADHFTRALLVISAVAVLLPMLLAVQWAVGWNYGTPALTIPQMAMTHGVVNAIGFAGCGVWAWRRLQRTSADTATPDHAPARSSAFRTTS